MLMMDELYIIKMIEKGDIYIKQAIKIISDLERDIDMDIVYFRDSLEEKKDSYLYIKRI